MTDMNDRPKITLVLDDVDAMMVSVAVKMIYAQVGAINPGSTDELANIERVARYIDEQLSVVPGHRWPTSE